MITTEVERQIAALGDEEALLLERWLLLAAGFEPDAAGAAPAAREAEVARRAAAVAAWDRAGTFSGDWYASLTFEDQERLLVQLQELLESRGFEPDFTGEQRAEIDRRIALGDGNALPWAEVRTRLFGYLDE
jgi:hypothetical protein